MKPNPILQSLLITVTAITILSSCNNNNETASAKQDILFSNLDTTVKPSEDFFEYANGGWIKKNPVQIGAKNVWYRNLEKSLQQLADIEKKGGWDSLPVTVKKYRSKKNTALIARLKRRLTTAGLLQASDTSAEYTASLQAAIKKAQAQYGYAHDTTLTAGLLRELNVPVQQRIHQIVINLQRMIWMPDMPDKEYILVNIPAFKLYVRKGNEPEFDMDIITGKEGHSTVVFSGNLNQVVFSPYWNVPPSIVAKEILPAMEKNSNYLERNGNRIRRRVIICL